MPRLAATTFLLAVFSAGVGAVDLPDSSLDPRFAADSANWVRSFTSRGATQDETVVGAARTADGGYVLAGGVPGGQVGERIFLTKLRADGSFDSAFGGNGGVGRVIKDAYLTYVTAMTLDSQGRIVVAGVTPGILGQSDFAVVRFLPNGADDTSFAGDGGVSIAFDRDVANNRANDLATGVATLPDGSIFVAGMVPQRSNNQPTSVVGVAKLTPAGVLDAGFGSGGRKEFCPYLCSVDWMARLVYDAPRNRLIFGGTFSGANAFSNLYLGAIALPAASSTVAAFSLEIDGSEKSATLNSLMVQRDGKVVLTGGVVAQIASQPFVLRSKSTAIGYDSDFGDPATPGYRVIDVNELRFNDVVQDSLGRLILAGETIDGRGAVQRLTTAGAIDTRFNLSAEPSAFAPPAGDRGVAYDTRFSAAFLDAGRVVLAGSATFSTANYDDYDQVVTRLNSDGIYADSFE